MTWKTGRRAQQWDEGAVSGQEIMRLYRFQEIAYLEIIRATLPRYVVVRIDH